jgi:hypothetical protein
MLDKEPQARPTATEVADVCGELCGDQTPILTATESTPTPTTALNTHALSAMPSRRQFCAARRARRTVWHSGKQAVTFIDSSCQY